MGAAEDWTELGGRWETQSYWQDPGILQRYTFRENADDKVVGQSSVEVHMEVGVERPNNLIELRLVLLPSSGVYPRQANQVPSGPDQCGMWMAIHGLPVDYDPQNPPQDPAAWNYWTHGIASPKTSMWRTIYASMVRGIDFLCSSAIRGPATPRSRVERLGAPRPSTAGCTVNRRWSSRRSERRSRNKWRKLPACEATIYRKLEAYATGKKRNPRSLTGSGDCSKITADLSEF